MSPNWELLVTSTLDGRVIEGPSLDDLPDELLPALSKFLFVAKDEAEQGTVDLNSCDLLHSHSPQRMERVNQIECNTIHILEHPH